MRVGATVHPCYQCSETIILRNEHMVRAYNLGLYERAAAIKWQLRHMGPRLGKPLPLVFPNRRGFADRVRFFIEEALALVW